MSVASGVIERTVKGAALFLINAGALDSMFESLASGLGIAVDKVAAFTKDLQLVYQWRRAKGDPRAAGDFPSFVDLYITDIVAEGVAARPLPVSKALTGLVGVLADLSHVDRKQWAGVVKDHDSFGKTHAGANTFDFGKLLVEAAREHGAIVVDVVGQDFAQARAWADLSNVTGE